MAKMWMIGMGLVVSLLWGCSSEVIQEYPVASKPEQCISAAVQSGTQPSSGSLLIAEKLISYDGPYGEDRSGDAVVGVAGLMLYNPTDRMIEFGVFALRQGSQQLYFAVSQLPPMSRCLILEKTRKPYQSGEIADFRELCIRWEYQQMSKQQLDYLGFGPQLTLINRDGRVQQAVVRYKKYVREGAYYLGGEAYCISFLQLQPGEHRTILPEHYHTADTRIVAIETI
ncbi:MAG: hypothetical protein E7454_03760 [Ruminococcaceae bacterium]|nr:hypothetical protein [Oscillospiraceae bacterium]